MANPDDLVDIDGLSTFLDGCDSRFASAGHTHTPASIGAAAANHTHTADDVGAVAVDTSGNAEGADVGNNQYGSYLSVDVGSDNRSVINWDDNGPFGSKYDGSNWTTTWDHRRPLLKTSYKNFTMNIASGSGSAEITAPTISGYTFVCWFGVASQGWVGSLYAEHYDQPTTKFWVSYKHWGPSGATTGSVAAFALYYRS